VVARYAKRVDKTQAEIVAAVRAAGWLVWLIGEPCDALCYRAGVWRTLEIKTPNRANGKYKPRKDQAEQNDFCERTGTPRVTTPHEAVAALGGLTFTGFPDSQSEKG